MQVLIVFFQLLAALGGVLFLMGAEVVFDGVFGVRGLAFAKPVVGGQRVGSGEHLHLVSGVEAFVAADNTAIELGADAVVP